MLTLQDAEKLQSRGAVSAKLATSCEKNLLALTHALFTQPVRLMQLGAFDHCQRLGLSPKRWRTKGGERITGPSG